MQSIQIDGTYTYATNISNIKIGDQIKLVSNPSNRLNSEAIGAYTLDGLKIGYVPFKSSQIDIKAIYTVTKINLTQNNPVLLISRKFEQSNYIHLEPQFIKDIKYHESNPNLKISRELSEDLKHFLIYLKKSGNEISELRVSYQDPNYVNLNIITSDDQYQFMTVTKKYYEDNIFKYDEFYKFKLIPKCIYQQFQIHRLEVYLEKKYNPINKLLKMKKLQFESLVNSGVFDQWNKINEDNFGFDTINTIKIPQLNFIKQVNSLNLTQLNNLVKLIVQFAIDPNPYYNPNNYLTNLDDIDLKPNLDEFINIFNKIKLGGMCYNHMIKYYCLVDLYDDINQIDISIESSIDKKKFIELLLKLVIGNKSIANLYNPITGVLLRLEVPELIRNKILNIISK